MARPPLIPFLVSALAAATLLAGCLQDDGKGPGGTQSPTSHPDAVPTTRFVALGDAGTGEDDQARVAAAIAAVCQARGCDFGLDLGDLIYPRGVESPTDSQFESKFEVPYAGLSFPFYMVLGNHDNSGDPAGADSGLGAWSASGDHMVAYGARTDRTSDKWTMPGRYYSFTDDAGLATFVALDTNAFLFEGVTVDPTLQAHIQEQEAAVPRLVADAATPWVFALGHHPYVSNGPHGDAGAYDGFPSPGPGGGHLKEFFEAELCGKVQVYFAGHDHNLQWLEPVASCGETGFIVSGGGGAATYPIEGTHPARFAEQTHGFWWIEVTEERLRAVAYDGEGAVLYEDTMERTGAAEPSSTPPA